MAFKIAEDDDVDHAADEALRQKAKREAAATESLAVTLGQLELRHHLFGGWALHGRDAATGTSVTIDSALWPDAERDAFLALPTIQNQITGSGATLRLTLRGQTKGREFVAQFVRATV